MSTIAHIKAPIHQQLKDFEPYFKTALRSKVPLLDIIMNYIVRRKGKQMRPMLVLLSAKMFGEIGESSYTAAALIELLHTATLIHDDVVDEAYQRRGFFSINALWKSKISVLAGDYILSKGLLLAITNNEFESLRIVSNAVREMAEGELLQLEKSRKMDITENSYFEIITKKTATLIASCTAAGASSVGADSLTVQKMTEFGLMAGITFQIKDDLFDYQPQGIIGKPTGNDIKEKKLTLPLIYVLNKISASEQRRIRKYIINYHNDKQKVLELIHYIHENGGIEYTEQKMYEYRNKALNILQQFPNNEARQSLELLVQYIVERKQ